MSPQLSEKERQELTLQHIQQLIKRDRKGKSDVYRNRERIGKKT